MNEKTFNTRIVHKHDTPENWTKAVNFVPKQGEWIVYDADNNCDHARVKLGDGVTKVGELPFLSETFLIDETLYGSTDQITPSQVADAVVTGKRVVLSYTDATYGLVVFTDFILMADIGSVAATGNGFYSGEYFIFNLAGDLNGGWHFFYDTVALKSDIKQADWDEVDEASPAFIKNKPDELDALEILVEMNMVSPTVSDDNSVFTDENGAMYSL